MYKDWLIWERIKIKYKIGYDKVVLVLAGENKALDKACLDHLPDFMSRKSSDRCLVFYPDDCYKAIDLRPVTGREVRFISMKRRIIERLYHFYSFMKFFDNIVFTYSDRPQDNLLQRFLDETDVNEEDAACLALYHLRKVPR
jgi:hypothetical protein